MVGRIIPVNKTAEDEATVTYTWGHPVADKTTRIVKSTGEVEPVEGTNMDESLYLGDYVRKVRVLNNMVDYPDECPIYR